MKKGLIRKGLVISIILLFVGVGIQPAFASESTNTIADSEDCIECQYNRNTQILEKILNKVENYKGLSNVIDSIKPQDDPPICDYILDHLYYYLNLADYYYFKALNYQNGSLMSIFYNSLFYMFELIGAYYVLFALLFDCDFYYPK